MLDDYLRHNPKAGLITNADDITLAPGDLDYLAELFGERAVIFPRGGHGGNLAERRFVETLIGFFKK